MKSITQTFFYQTVVLSKYTFLLLLLVLSISIAAAQEASEAAPRKIADELDYLNMPLDTFFVWFSEHALTDYEDFYQVLNELKDKAYALNDPRLISEIHYRIATWNHHHHITRVDTSIYHMEKCIEFLEQTDDKILLGSTYDHIAVDYLNNNEVDKAHDVIMKGMAIYKEIEEPEGIALMEARLASIYNLTNEPEKAIFYADRSIKEFEKYDNKQTEIFLILVDKMNANTDLKKTEEALKIAEEALLILETELADIPQKDHFKAYLLQNRGHTFLESKQYKKALLDYENSEKLGWDEISGLKAKVLFFQGKYKEALAVLKPVHENFDFENHEDTYSNLRHSKNYLVFAQIYEKNSRFKEAYYLYKLGAEGIKTTYEDKIKNLESEAIVKYETGKKDQAIASQASQLEQKTKIQNLTFGGLGLLASLLFGLFYFFRKNKKVTRELDIKNKQNEVLLKEIHHRVKNNLQTISSLLSLQSKSINDKSALDAVQESRNRVSSMALIHQKLYQGENLAAIEMRDYFETIGKAILNSFGEKAKGVELHVEMSEIELDVDTAIPIGLITNELITNSLKYAFNNTPDGKISISMKKDENNLIQLSIADNGIHNNTNTNEDGTGFGTMLINLLTTQLEGNLEQSTDQGTTTTIQFSLENKAAA